MDVDSRRLRAKEKVRKEELIYIDNALLNIREVSEYLGIGETKAKELLHNPRNGFTVRIGNRLYAHKGKLDIWLKNQTVQKVIMFGNGKRNVSFPVKLLN